MTWSDRKQADALLGGEPQLGVTDTTVLTGSVLVVDLFAGIGGLEEALKRAGIGKHYTVFVERNRECRRLLKRRRPATHIVNDIKAFGKQDLARAFETCPNAQGIIVAKGPPCQSLGIVRGEPEESGDSGHKLFFDVVRVFKLVDEVTKERGIWTVKFMENVVTALDDLEHGPKNEEYFDWKTHELFDKLIIKGAEAEPLISFLRPECSSSVTRDEFRYPLQAYAQEFMVETQACEERPLVAEEREVLMGYPRHYTMALLKKAPTTLTEEPGAEDVRCAALGYAFHVTTLAILLDQVLGAMRLKGIRGPMEIAQSHVEESMQRFVEVKLEQEVEEAVEEGAGPSEATKNRRDRKEDEESAAEAGR
ncbi:Cytosine-specific methyltransferase [Durusdinium trenchii]|uniref:Cytosine-specific methyltransferase n=1 Tax=Durusdinium trenchii TaxID=1381693 RepID=A0ABP0H6X0_9DINO